MRHSVKIKLIICGGFAVLLLLVIRLTALREDSKLLDFISKESNRPLVKVSNTDRVDGTGPISKSLLESKSRTHGRFTTSKNPSVLFSIWMFDSLSGLLFAVFILLQLMVNNSFSIVFCPEAVLRIRCQHVNVLLPLGSHGRIRQDVPQAVKGIAAVRNVGGMNYAHFVSALPGGATPQVLLSLR